MNKSSQLNESMIISDANKYPNLFGWKVGALVLCISTIALLFACTGLLVYLGLSAPPKTDFTFLNTIVIESEIITTKTEVLSITENLKAANQEMKYKFCDKQKTYTFEVAFERNMIYEIFEKNNDDILFIMELKAEDNATYNNIFGVFVDTSFPVPQREEFQNSVRYFTFDIRDQDQKQTTFFAISSNSTTKYLKFNQSADAYDDCEVYSLGTTDFGLLSSLNITYSTVQTFPKVAPLLTSYKCFFPRQDSEQTFSNSLKQLLGNVNWNNKLVLNRMEVYHLY